MALDNATRDRLKWALREAECPHFSDTDLDTLWVESGEEFNEAAYQGLLIKAQDDSLQVSGLTIQSSSKYFRRLAAKYRPRNTGTLIKG